MTLTSSRQCRANFSRVTCGARRILDKIAVMEACDDNAAVMLAYERWQQAYPQREFYFAHTGREELDIRERRSWSRRFVRICGG